MSGDSIIECVDVSREYTRGASGGRLFSTNSGVTVTALDDVSLQVSRGEFLGITGPSGSGKSTLLHLLGALDTPTSGTVSILGTQLGELSARQRTRFRLDHIGIVFQRFYLLPALSARANVGLPLIERGVGKNERRERATALLEEVGLADRITHRPGSLSGGEQQRVAIARALVTEPDLLIADEPTGELDTETGAGVLDLFRDLSGDRTVVVASHDQQALDRADRRLGLLDGRVDSVETVAHGKDE